MIEIFLNFYILSSMTIGENLRRLRNEKGLSLRKLQREVGISHNTIEGYEINSIQPTIKNCYKLCKYFDVPLEYLFLGEESLKDFQDVNLLVLFNKIDKMDKEDRTTIKKYILKYMKSKKELEKLKNEAD